jgi:hypothetical protein
MRLLTQKLLRTFCYRANVLAYQQSRKRCDDCVYSTHDTWLNAMNSKGYQ